FVEIQPYGNTVDCAIARLTAGVNDSFPPDTVRLSGAVGAPERDQMVRKVGASTGFTEGRIVDVDVDLYVPYSFLDNARFDGQFMITAHRPRRQFASGGDSGGLGGDENGRGIGILFPFSGQYAVACPLDAGVAEPSKRLEGRSLRLVAAENRPAEALQYSA